MKFRKKIIEVDAIVWNGSNAKEIQELLGFAKETSLYQESLLKIKTRNNMSVYASIGNYIVKDGDDVDIYSKEDFNKNFIKNTKQIKEDLKNE